MSEAFRQSVEYRVNKAGFRHDISKEEITDHYSRFSEDGKYETYLSLDRYKAPVRVAEIMDKVLNDYKSERILDCGAGTGYIGELLGREGFNNLIALEPSQGMADVARKKNVYRNIHVDFIDESYSPFDENTFYALVSVGTFGPGHIPPRALYEMVRVVKPGGLVILAMRAEYFDECPDLERLMKEMENCGKWELREKHVYPGHFFELNGVCVIYKVL